MTRNMSDMSNIMTRLFTVIMLMMFSMGASADVKVLFGEKGTELQPGKDGTITLSQKELTGGTIIISQEDQKDGTSKVTFAVTPDKNYKLAKDGLEVYAVAPTDINPTRGIETSTKLTLKSDDYKDDTSKRTYTATIDNKLALWLKSADFQPTGRDGAKNTKVSDGIYYIRNNSDTKGYLWPSLTTNTTTGYRYLTTSLDVSAPAVNNNNVSYAAHDKSYSHWVVKNVTEGYIQLINPRLNKYVVIRKFPKENNTKENVYGDRDVWLTDEPAAEDIDYTYFVLNNNSAPYKISPKEGLNNVSNTSGYTFNSAAGSDRVFLTWSKTDGKPYTGEGRDGLIQIYSGGTPLWSFTSDLLDAPNISDVDEYSKATVTDANGLPDGYNIRYTIDGNDPTASSPIMEGHSFTVTSSLTLKAVVERYGVVLTAVASKALEPAPCATPVITYNNTTSKVSITCLTVGSSIYYTINGSNPTASSTEYSEPFSVSSPTTVKAIATHTTFATSAVAELAISQVATPTIQDNGSNAISITTTTPAATIYYTIDGTAPTTSSTLYEGPLTENVSNVTIKAIAVKENMITSAVGSGTVKLQCVTPVIKREGMTFTLSCSFPVDANLYYTMDGGPETLYSGPVSFTSDQLPMTVTAVARHNDYIQSETATMELINGSGTPEDPYLIYGATDFTNFIIKVNEGTTSSECYKLETDVSASGVDAITTAFKGTFDGGMHTISGLGHALFNTVNGGVVKNVILDNVGISGGTNVGAICNEATGNTRIYNCGVLASNSTVEKDEDGYDKITSCSSSISGSGYVGGIVGLLDGTSRVINCFSYANVSGGSYVGGIVGYNNVASATPATELKTMVMNCMFYGEVSGSSIAPIYNGNIITNIDENKGVGNYNYFRLEASYVQPTGVTYNCALGAEDRYLQRFEFFRNLLNSHRELAGWWATGTYSSSEMMKWVLEPSQLGTSTPYPILKVPGKYPSVVNIDAKNATTQSERNKGGKLGTLTVKIQMGNGAVYNHPGTGENEAKITTSQLTLNITDKDPDHFNFNYYKVQLPYYNDVGTKNYTGNRVVTGWKIVSISDGTTSFTTGSDAETNASGEITKAPYNFADRNCTEKDLYSKSGRVFNQGAYWDVPEGVTSITIEPYWAKCVYLADQNADKVYDADMTTGYNVPNVGGGQKYTNGNSYSIAGENQVVFTAIGNAIASSGTGTALFQGVNNFANHTVYDYAVVLVGNYHHYYNQNIDKSKPYTVTSIDLDGDNEPDYSYILRYNGRCETHPVRADFINIPGLGMAQKSTGGTGSYNFGIMIPTGWFESTNTSLLRFTQFEYEHSSRSETDAIIVQGGVIEQWVSYNQKGRSNNIPYIHVGGNVWFKEFHTGCHQDKNQTSGDKRFQPTKHSPISVTGGDFDEFYLTGLYVANVSLGNYEDNAECYINGGRFGTVCGAAMEGIGKANGADNTGNITWLIQNADIHEFYAGGLNAAKPVTGNLSTTIVDSHVDIFCGGPKFGDMSDNKTVVTNATGCTFGIFFGAGYGGNSYSRQAPRNHNNIVNFPHNDSEGAGNNSNWNDWLDDHYTQAYSDTYGGVSTQFSYQFLPMSNNGNNVARIFVDYVKFSLATCHNVTSSLTGCTITGSFYGGGSLGKVDGNVTSTLTDCEIQGSAFGAGYSASLPTVEVDAIGFTTEPYYYTELGTYRKGVKGSTTTYTWEGKTGNLWVDNTNHILYTTEDLTTLGTVSGKVTLNIEGNTLVMGNVTENNVTTQSGGVFGGGDSSEARGDTEVNIDASGQQTGYTYNTYNVFGGGNKANVRGAVTVNMKQGVVGHDIYGGGALANTNTDNWNGSELTNDPYYAVTITTSTNLTGYYSRSGGAAPYTYTAASGTASSGTYYKKRDTKVNMTGGTVKGDVYGGGLGRLAATGVEAKEATVYGDVLVTINGTKIETGYTSGENPEVNAGRVFGANNINGTPKGHVKVLVQKTAAVDGQDIDVAAVFGGGNQAAYVPYNTTNGYAEVEINKTPANGRLIVGNVYGGGNMAGIGNTTTTTGTQVNIVAGDVKTGIYGGCNTSGTVSGDTKVSVIGGTIGTAWESAPASFPTLVFGGGLGDQTLVSGDVMVELGAMTDPVAPATTPTISGDATIWGDVYGGSAKGIVNAEWTGSPAALSPTGKTTSVAFYSGTLNGNLYGGGLGDADHAADVYGNITVNIGAGKVDQTTGVVTAVYGNATINGSVYGCNNTKGTPMGDVFVNIYKTAHTTGDVNNKYPSGITTLEGLNSLSNDDTRFAIKAVYGGGNLAHYTPVASTGSNPPHSTTVRVFGCSENTIKTVYGGGNAADVGTSSVSANTNIIIEGGRFDSVFGGGNGFSETRNHNDPTAINYNPGANIYGTATTEIQGGLYNQIFGGSNQYGNVRTTSLTINKLCDDLLIKESFGGANEADITGDVTTTLACGRNIIIGTFYGGSNKADIEGSVTLNVEGGTYINVFGGSKGVIDDPDTNDDESISADISGDVTLNLYGGIMDNAFGGSDANGSIGGKITVNMLDKEAAGCGLTIHNIYGGGRDAAYSPATSGAYPEVNLIYGSVTKKDDNTGGNVFGGGLGSTATVTSNPTVYVGYDTSMATRLSTLPGISTLDNSTVSISGNVYGGGDEAAVTGSTSVTLQQHTAEGFTSDSAVGGDMYGGGNQANVSGSVTVSVSGGSVTGDVYGGGALANTNTDQTTNIGTDESPAHHYTTVTVTGGIVYGSIYGGGLGRIDAEDDPATTEVNEAVSAIEALVYGAVTVTVNGGTVANVFGCNNVNGAPQSTVQVDINNNVSGSVYGGGNLASYTAPEVTATNTTAHDYPLVNIMNGTVGGSVFGGGYGSTAEVTGNPKVTIGDNTSNTTYAVVTGNVYGGGDAAPVTGNTTVTYNDNNTSSTVYQLFGGGNAASVSGTSIVTLTSGKVTGGIYGGCNSSGSVGAVTIALNGGNIGAAATQSVAEQRADVFGGGYGHSTTTTGDVTVNIGTATTSGGTTSYSGSAIIYGDVYGGSALGQVNGSGSTTILNINSNSIHGTIYGGGMGSGTGEDTKATTNGDVQINYNTANTDLVGLYGGANANGNVVGNIEVNIKANLGASGAGRDLFGGGLGAATSTNGNVTVNIGDLTLNDSNNPVYNPVVYGNIYGGSSLGSVNDAVTDYTTVNILSGTINGNTYGGGLGQAGEANVAKGQVNGTVIVNIGSGTVNSTTGFATETSGFATFVAASDGSSGSIYGCNNTNGSPKGNVTVNVYQTAHTQTDEASYTGTDATYAIDQVFGGGNQANYNPTSSDSRATIHVYTCDNTIRRVFGGGNAAAAVGVVTQIDGGHFDYVYGGGNGEVTAANIGAGGTNLQIHGGEINNLFGGSNASGTITGNMGVSVDNICDCEGSGGTAQYVNEFFCGNNLASIGTSEHPVDITATIACGTSFGDVYGGCNQADIYGNVTLTILGGTMDNVFGGSKGTTPPANATAEQLDEASADINGNVTLNIYGGIIENAFGGSNVCGNITGTITVNMLDMEGTGDCGFTVNNVYGGGQDAAYTPTYALPTGTNERISPIVNIIHGTVSKKAVTSGETTTYTGGNVYGGGKGTSATVNSSPKVNVGYNAVGETAVGALSVPTGFTRPQTYTAIIAGNVYGGGDAAPVNGNARVIYNDNSTTTSVANIFGGGNNASVSGNATVTLKGKATVEGDVFGGGNNGIVGGTATVKIEE